MTGGAAGRTVHEDAVVFECSEDGCGETFSVRYEVRLMSGRRGAWLGVSYDKYRLTAEVADHHATHLAASGHGFTCPRRRETGMDSEDSPLVGAGRNKDYWEEDATCSWCGSMRPEDFIAAVRDGARVGATDKNYKLYLGVGAGLGVRKMYTPHFEGAEDAAWEFVLLRRAGVVKWDGGFEPRELYLPGVYERVERGE